MHADTTRLAEQALRAGPLAQVVVDERGAVVVASDRAVDLLGDACVHGRPLGDRELRALAVRAATTGVEEKVSIDGALSVRITPLATGAGAALTFLDVSAEAALGITRHELRETVAELASLSAQLQLGNTHLRAVSDELAAANSELETLNDELRERALQLAELGAGLEDVVRACGRPALVADPDRRIRVWTKEAAELWGRAAPATLEELGLGALAQLGEGASEAVAEGPGGTAISCRAHAVAPAGLVVVFMRPG